jgi:hypothetical protein
MHIRLSLSAILCCCALGAQHAPSDYTWTFTVSGDSRNCGDVVMPSIAAGSRQASAAFYWHLGDLRAISDFDQDFKDIVPATTILNYTNTAWDDFVHHQMEPFGDTPFFVGMGNHETIPPKSRKDFIVQFADWLDSEPIRAQRLRDEPQDRAVRTYYHWVKDGIDFINLDNASPEQFDAAQLAWINLVLGRDEADQNVRAVVVGMHEALPDSIAKGHSMSDSPVAEASGRQVYQKLLSIQKSKPVYVLASHSHFFMEGIFNTPYLREHGGVLPGWIVGTAGAVRYPLPPGYTDAKTAQTHVYGYLLAKVSPRGTNDRDPIWFEFHEVKEADVPAPVAKQFGSQFVHTCYADNPKVD